MTQMNGSSSVVPSEPRSAAKAYLLAHSGTDSLVTVNGEVKVIAEAVASGILPIASTKTALLARISAERPRCTDGRRVAMSRLPYRGLKNASLTTRWLVNGAQTISNTGQHAVRSFIIAFVRANIAGPAPIRNMPHDVSGVAEGEARRPANVRKRIRPPARARRHRLAPLAENCLHQRPKGFSRTGGARNTVNSGMTTTDMTLGPARPE